MKNCSWDTKQHEELFLRPMQVEELFLRHHASWRIVLETPSISKYWSWDTLYLDVLCLRQKGVLEDESRKRFPGRKIINPSSGNPPEFHPKSIGIPPEIHWISPGAPPVFVQWALSSGKQRSYQTTWIALNFFLVISIIIIIITTIKKNILKAILVVW